jgi:hypothetical protein
MLKSSTSSHAVRRCVFLPDNGAFFVNYIITSTFIGAAIELLRLADLVSYIYIIATAKSSAERRVIRHVSISSLALSFERLRL